MSANINYATNTVRTLDRIPETATPLTESDVKDASNLVRLFSGLLRDVQRLLGLWRPKRIDFTDVVSEGSTLAAHTIELAHGFGCEVRWWIVDTQTTGGLISVTYVRREPESTADVLVLSFYYPGRFTIRVEEAG